jgi:hypothetical protein
MGKGFAPGLFLGLALGSIVGWLLFGRERQAPARVVYMPAPYEDEEGGLGEEVDEPPPRPPSAEARVLDAGTLRDATAEELDRITDEEVRVPPDAVADLIARLERARQERDGKTFRTLLFLLGEVGTPEAHRKLIELMGDTSLAFPGAPVGTAFLRWLRDSEEPGIAAAARARVERELEANPGSNSLSRGWLALVAAHGGPADIDWILSRDAPAGDREAIEAFASVAERPEAVRHLQELFRNRTRPWFSGNLRLLAEHNPEAAMALFEEGFANPRRGEEKDLARVYGDVLRPEDLPRAKGLLLNLGKPMAAVYAIDRMHRRGLDISGLESILNAPVEALERAALTPGATGLYEARYAVERNRILWSERAATALEAAAASASRKERGALLAAARRVRAGIGGAGTGEWDTR